MSAEQFSLTGAEGEEAMEVQLWEYIDGLTPASERAFIEQLIAEQTAWKAKYEELLEIHQLVQATELEQPSMRFTRNVMEEIAKYQIAPATKQYINSKIIWGIMAFFITVITAFLVYGFAQIDWTTATDHTSAIGIDLTSVDYSRMFNNTFVNVFLMLNVVLGLMLFDRYLNNRNRKLMEEM